MSLTKRTRLDVVEEPAGLLVVATSDRRWQGFFLACGVGALLGVAIVAGAESAVLGGLAALLVASFGVSLWRARRVVRVTERGLALSGGGLREAGRESLVAWSAVEELHYAAAGQGQPEGLYWREGEWCSRCLLAGLSEAQVERVVGAIAGRYPEVPAPGAAAEGRRVAQGAGLEGMAAGWRRAAVAPR